MHVVTAPSRISARPAVLAFALLLLLAGVATLLGCGRKGGGQATAQDPNPLPEEPLVSTAPDVGRPGGHIVCTETAGPKTFNYIVANEQGTYDVCSRIYDALTTFNNATKETEPAIAKSWEISPDSLTWTFHIRKGARFSDGHAITSADFKFMYDVVMDSTTECPSRDALIIDGRPVTCEAPDPYTIVFRTPIPYGGFADRVVGNIYAEPKHILEPLYKAGQFAAAYGVDTAPGKLVTSGPFMLKRYVANEKVVLQRNPYYYMVDKNRTRLPYLDELIYVIVPDQNTELLKFQSGEADVIEYPRPEDYASLKKDAGAKGYDVLELGPRLSTNFFWFNLNLRKDGKRPVVAPYKYAWFSDLRFRHALAYAVDRTAMGKTAFYNQAVENWGPSTKATGSWHDPNVAKYPYNPAKAQALLAEMGFADKNRDGFLEDAAGHTIEFTMFTNSSNTVRVQMLTMLQADFKKIGVRMHPQPLDFNELVTKARDSFDYDAILLGLASGVPPDPALSTNVYKSSGVTHFWRPKQPTPGTAWEAQVDSLMDIISTSFDSGRRHRAWFQVQEQLTQQAVFIYLPSQTHYVCVRKGYGNIRATTIPQPVMWNAQEMFFKGGKPPA